MRLLNAVRYAAMVAVFAGGVAQAQFAGTSPHDDFRDTSILRPPAGSKVAILVWEDLGCPACARWHPVEDEVARKTHVTLVRHDFPLAQHVWTFEGAVFARYLHDKVSPKLADEYRSDVFKSQMQIESKDALHQFNEHWMQTHHQQMPFVVDPGGKLAKEVQADFDLGVRLNVEYTPTIVVVTNGAYQVISGVRDYNAEPSKLLEVVEGAMAKTGARPAAAHHATHAQKLR